jgi:hypothetical protein
LETCIQNEKNASAFYRHLAQAAPRPEDQHTLHTVQDRCDRRNTQLYEAYQGHYSQAYAGQAPPEFPGVDFSDGLAWAIAEEAAALRDLNELYQQTADGPLARLLNGQMHCKLGDIALLHLMRA